MRVSGSLFTQNELSQSVKDGRFTTYSGYIPTQSGECVVLDSVYDIVSNIYAITGSLLRYPYYNELQPTSSGAPTYATITYYFYNYSCPNSNSYIYIYDYYTGSYNLKSYNYSPTDVNGASFTIQSGHGLYFEIYADDVGEPMVADVYRTGSYYSTVNAPAYYTNTFGPVTVSTGETWAIYVDVSGTGCGGPCLVAGTQILMLDGSYKSIESLEIGDLLKSFDIASMPKDCVECWDTWSSSELLYEESSATVLSLTEHTVPYIININNGMLKTSRDHKHVVKQGDTWGIKNAFTLKVGDIFININGEEILIDSLNIEQGPVTVYNIAVDNQHTYFANDILTHNKPLP